MPYYRKRRVRRRRPYRKKRYARRSRIPRSRISHNSMIIRQTFTDDFDIPASSAGYDFISRFHSFKLNDIDPTQLASIQRLFTQFCIKSVTVKYFCTETNTAPVNSTMLSKFYWVSTKNPYAVAGDWITESQGPNSASRCRSKYLGKYQLTQPYINMRLTPVAATQINNPGSPLAGLVASRTNLWLNTINNFATPHNGLRTAFSFAGQPHPAINYQVSITYTLALRNVV